MKRSEIKKRPLADTVLASLEPEPTEYRELHDDGLYLRVKPNGGKSWQLRYKNQAGRWGWIGIGSYPAVGGALARRKAADLRKLIGQGIDPLQEKRGQQTAAVEAERRLFRNVTAEWFQSKTDNGRAPATLEKMRFYLDKDVLPALGDKHLDEITREDCADLQRALEDREAHNVATKVRGWLNDIFGWAIGHGLTENDPASRLVKVAKAAPKQQRYPSLTEAELPDFLRALQKSDSRLPARTAAWLCLWTASRPGMVRWAEWAEFDLEAAIWTVPAAKMKDRERDHVVPLSQQAVEALRDLHRVTGQSRWVFPGSGPKTPVISENTIGKVFDLIGYKGRMSAHGSRHTFSTIAREHGWQREHVEAQLAHIVRGVEGRYNQAQYLEQRRELVQWYADHLDKLAAGNVVEMKRA